MAQNELITEQINKLISLFSSGEIKKTLQIAESLAIKYSENAILHNIIGACYAALNLYHKSILAYQKSISIHPEYVEAHFNLGLAYQDLGNLDESLKSYKNAISFKPDYSEAHNNLGNIFKALGSIENSIESYQNAIKFNDEYFEAHYNLGDLYQGLNQPNLAIKYFEKVLLIKPNFAELHNNIAVLYTEINESENALEHLNKALKINPDFSEAYNNLSNIYLENNDLNQAIAGYEKAIDTNINYAEAYYNLSMIAKYNLDAQKQTHIQSMLNNKGINLSDKVYFSFALALTYEKLKHKGKFFDALNSANELQSKKLNYSLNKDQELFSKIKNFFILKPNPLRKKLNQRSIFIVGMPRSGTSLVEQIIASHNQVYGGGELTIMPDIIEPLLDSFDVNEEIIMSEENLSSIRLDYHHYLSGLNIHQKIVTDKMPLNFQYIGFILSAFPDAKIINLNRSSIATCWSNYKCLFSDDSNSFSYSFDHLIGFYKLYEDLMEFWHEKYPNRIYDISYEELTSNQEEETRKLLNYCELDWDENCLNFHKNKRAVKTASSLQVRKKMYQGSSDAWREYEEFLQPLIRGLNQ